MKSIKHILILFLFVTSIVAENYAGLSGGFLRIGTSARSTSMGSAFTAEMDHGFSAYHNPAWAAFNTDKQVGFNYQTLSLDRRLAVSSFSAPLPPTAGVGVAWLSAGVTDIQGRSSSGEKTEIMNTSEDAFFITFSQRIKPWLSVGANFKILRNQLPTNDGDLRGSGLGFDIGILIKSGKGQTIGLMIQDMSSNYQWNTGDIYDEGRPYKDEFPTLYRIGTKYIFNNFLFVGDLGFITNHQTFMDILPRAGLEYVLMDQYYVRGGYGNNRFSAGIGMDYKLLKSHDSRLDYAFSMDIAGQMAHIMSYAFHF
ncbi:MAG: PorV/PorQ family protein [Candidatus Marinimicrobia bacterium]|jgi:hypothetical protein|nr:PorV/PorQ family protein [Candidatus Neomarinimicrobiota bacterium]MBT3936993.1 PorV/PorQ family protein [Candidatus Neomarinimicrobiota bacterium]MBT3960758.1 PorV/PorQ family protein [Candidatus Neomarinimicrobiota bacterium]MBT4383840.1 PorV/PorQ family protein [Candidatus Neomarinimicrobiota bacterium]MBT4636813.1 PorV/PorQ family protein [Candidatus Neomarinimicrobiota bacterium]